MQTFVFEKYYLDEKLESFHFSFTENLSFSLLYFFWSSILP